VTGAANFYQRPQSSAPGTTYIINNQSSGSSH